MTLPSSENLAEASVGNGGSTKSETTLDGILVVDSVKGASKRNGWPVSLEVDAAVGATEGAGVGRVVSVTAGETLRILLFLMSDTYRVPSVSTATPYGRLNETAAPTPSAKAADPDPAIVVTKPNELISRILLLP